MQEARTSKAQKDAFEQTILQTPPKGSSSTSIYKDKSDNIAEYTTKILTKIENSRWKDTEMKTNLENWAHIIFTQKIKQWITSDLGNSSKNHFHVRTLTAQAAKAVVCNPDKKERQKVIEYFKTLMTTEVPGNDDIISEVLEEIQPQVTNISVHQN